MKIVASSLSLLAALAMTDAARYGWGAATIEGDRVKWGLRSMGRSPMQPVIVIKDFCRWRDAPRGLCALEPGSEWAAAVFRWAAPMAWLSVAGFVATAALLYWRRGLGQFALLITGAFTVALGVAAVFASHRISIYVNSAVNPGWSGSLTWRAALLLTVAAFVAGARAQRVNEHLAGVTRDR